MPNFGTNDNDRRTAEALEKIWAQQRKEQAMSSVYTDDQFDKMLLAMGPFSMSEQRMIDYALALRQRAEQADASADTYALLLRKLTKDDTLLAAYRRSKNLDHRGVPVVSDVVLEMLRKEEAALGREK